MSKVKERAVRERQIREIKILNQKCLQRCSTNPPPKCRVWHIDSHTEFAGWYENDVTLQFIFGNLSWPQMYVCTNMNRIILYNFRHSQNVQKKSSHKLAHATASPHAHLHTQSHTHSHTHTRTHTHSVTHQHTQTHTHTCTRIRDFHTHRRWMRPPHPSCGLRRVMLQLSSWRSPCTPRDSASSRIAVPCLHIHNIARRRQSVLIMWLSSTVGCSCVHKRYAYSAPTSSTHAHTHHETGLTLSCAAATLCGRAWPLSQKHVVWQKRWKKRFVIPGHLRLQFVHKTNTQAHWLFLEFPSHLGGKLPLKPACLRRVGSLKKN